MTWLPGADLALIDDVKVRDYLLLPGGGKIDRFEAFGFGRADWRQLALAIAAHPLTNRVTAIVETIHGMKYVVTCNLATPDGRNPCLTTVWIVDAGAVIPRLVTAY